MYLKVYHTAEFFAACINSYDGDIDNIVKTIQEAKRMNVTVEFAPWRESQRKTTCKNGKVILGINTIKGCGGNVADGLMEVSKKDNNTAMDLVKNITENTNVDKSQFDTLIKLGFFSPEFCSIGTLLRIIDMYNLYGSKKIIKKDKCALPPEILSKYCTETAKQYKITDSDGLLQELCGMIPKDCRVPLMSEIRWQQEYLGYCSIIVPEQKDVGYVMNVDCKYSPKITMYLLDKSATVTYKLSKAAYQKQPFDTGDFIQMRTEQRNKSRKTENGWEKVPNEYDTWITAYIIKNNL